MFEVIANLIDKFQVLLLLGFGVATAAAMLFAYVKTRSTPAVLGMAFLGIAAMVLVANMTTFADKFGGDVLGGEQTTVNQVTGRATPATPTTAPGDQTPTTVCTQEMEVQNRC